LQVPYPAFSVGCVELKDYVEPLVGLFGVCNADHSTIGDESNCHNEQPIFHEQFDRHWVFNDYDDSYILAGGSLQTDAVFL